MDSTSDTSADTSSELSFLSGETSSEDLFEIIEGKNEDGTSKVKNLSRAEMVKLAQLGFGADAKFKEAATSREEAQATKQQMAELAKMLRDDPFTVLKHLGQNPDDIVARHFNRQLEESLIDPRDRELEQYKSQLKHFQEQEKARTDQEQNSKIEARANEIRTGLFNKIEEALSSAGMAKNERTVAEVGKYLQSLNGKNDSNGNPINILEFPVHKIVAHIKQSRSSEFTNLYESLNEDEILAQMDPKILEKFGRALSKKLGVQSRPVQKVPVFESDTDKALTHREKIEQLQKIWEKNNKAS